MAIGAARTLRVDRKIQLGNCIEKSRVHLDLSEKFEKDRKTKCIYSRREKVKKFREDRRWKLRSEYCSRNSKEIEHVIAEKTELQFDHGAAR